MKKQRKPEYLMFDAPYQWKIVGRDSTGAWQERNVNSCAQTAHEILENNSDLVLVTLVLCFGIKDSFEDALQKGAVMRRMSFVGDGFVENERGNYYVCEYVE